MKPAARRRLASAIRELSPDLEERGPMLLASTTDRVLRGIFIEGSAARADAAYVWAFVQPLYVPAATVVLSLGRRLGGGAKTWSADEAELVGVVVRDEGAPFFEGIGSPKALADWSNLRDRSDPYAMEARAYSLVADARFLEGAEALRALTSSVQGAAAWVDELRERARRLAALAAERPDEAVSLLAEWEHQTASALGLR